MNSRVRQYFFGLIFAGIGVYYLIQPNYLEASLYIMAGFCFAINAIVSEPSMERYRKELTIVAWIFIIATAILFLWVLQSRYF